MRRIRVRCLAPGLAVSAFLVVVLQWYTLQVLHTVRREEHVLSSFVGSSVPQEDRRWGASGGHRLSPPLSQSMYDGLEEEREDEDEEEEEEEEEEEKKQQAGDRNRQPKTQDSGSREQERPAKEQAGQDDVMKSRKKEQEAEEGVKSSSAAKDGDRPAAAAAAATSNKQGGDTTTPATAGADGSKAVEESGTKGSNEGGTKVESSKPIKKSFNPSDFEKPVVPLQLRPQSQDKDRPREAAGGGGKEAQQEQSDAGKVVSSHDTAGLAAKYKTIGVYSIFIGVYKTFLPDFLVNMRSKFVPTYAKVFFLVTDDAKLCDRLHKEEKDVRCIVKDRIGWPYETLYRWSYFQDFNATDTDYVWFFNSNSQCVDTIQAEEVLAPHTVVLHDLFVGKPYDHITFEKRPLSFAFVPNRPHYRYFGARMIGATTENFKRMCQTLDRNTRLDEVNHFIADWHDESHYNHYINVELDGKVKVLGIEYHVPEEYGAGYMPTGRKMIYLDKKQHITDLDGTKSPNWQDWVGGEVKITKYFQIPDFRAEIYRELNYEAREMTETRMVTDYIENFEKRLYFFETDVFADSFDVARYRAYYEFTQSEMWCKLHYYRWGHKESRYYFLKQGAEKHDIAIPTVVYHDERDPPKGGAVAPK